MQNTENRFKHDGVWYEESIITDQSRSCAGCAGKENDRLCLSLPCCAKGRKDNQNVIFVRSDVDNLGDEE